MNRPNIQPDMIFYSGLDSAELERLPAASVIHHATPCTDEETLPLFGGQYTASLLPRT